MWQFAAIVLFAVIERTLQDARIDAVRRIGRLLAEEAARFWKGDEWTMDVTDPTGLKLFTLTFMATNSPATRAYPKVDNASFRDVGDEALSSP
jgi:hypothetical protein